VYERSNSRYASFGSTKLCRDATGPLRLLGKQLLRSGTSVAAHYREASRAKSNLDFVSKLESALQELDETDLWIELLGESGLVKTDRVTSLRAETNQLIAILVTMAKKVKARAL
jgi:four helix bundle protein